LTLTCDLDIVLKTLSGVVNYYELVATCSKYSIETIDVTDMSENIIKQTIWKVFSHTVGADW